MEREMIYREVTKFTTLPYCVSALTDKAIFMAHGVLLKSNMS